MFATTLDENEKQAAGSLYVWLVQTRDTDYAVETFVELNTPKKVFGLGLLSQSCPNCGRKTRLYNEYNQPNERCGNCGQLLSWEENEED